MSDKFKYAPGKPGFGSKGRDGSIGLQGLAMYFTDLDPVTDIITITNKITNNFVLWKGTSSSLPDQRTYVAGDLFFDSDGKAYEISNPDTGSYQGLGGSLNMGGFFVPLGINSDDGFQRYFNSNSSPKYIIDNIYTKAGAINYAESPIDIYGITPENFARIEYSNVLMNGTYNPFTVYSSGEAAGSDDWKSIAIVRRDLDNTFRIGNLDDAGNIRDVNLIFDVSSLTHNKQVGSYFNSSSPPGTILTNYEIEANSLFDPNFNSVPSSFLASMATTSATINWNLLDFTGDSDVKGDLYFYEQLSPGTFRIDSSAARPLIFSNIANTGPISITGLSGTKSYRTYIKLNKNGWTRNSVTKEVFNGILTVTPTSLLNEPSVGYSLTNKFNVVANSTWDVSFGIATWISNITPVHGTGDGSIGFELSQNTGALTRNAIMRVTLSNGTMVPIGVSQKGTAISATFNFATGARHQTPYGSIPYLTVFDASMQSLINQTGLPTDTVFDVSLFFVTNVYNYNQFNNIGYANWARVKKAGGTYVTKKFMNSPGNPGAPVVPGNSVVDSDTIALTNLTYADFPLTVYMTLHAISDTSPVEPAPNYYSYESKLECNNMQIYIKSGTPVIADLTNFSGIPSTVYGYSGPIV